MDKDLAVRKHLIWLLKGGGAHMNFDDAIKDFPEEEMNKKFPNSTYSFWGALEHVRRTQADILDFIKNPNYEEREWPNDYWPDAEHEAAKEDWEKTVMEYKEDLAEILKIVKDPRTNLYEKIPHGEGQTILREILLVADHTAYQIGELATMRRVFGHWDISHE